VTQQPEEKKQGIGKQLIGIAVAALFLWFAFKGTDFNELWHHIQKIQPFYLVMVGLSGLTSHFLRAWRWVTLLSPLSDKKISLWNSFCAVMVGYAVNVVIPRGGEVARLVSISRSEQLPWAGVLSTMFIDRLLDIALLVFLLGFTLTMLPSEFAKTLPWLVPGGISLTVSTVVGLLLLPYMSSIIKFLLSRNFIKDKLPEHIFSKITNLSDQFDLGTKSLKNPVAYPAIAILSVLIWFFYWLNFYLMIYAFGLEAKVSAAQCLTVFTIGSVGVLVPTPGSVGSFHFLVSQGLMMVAGVNKDLALAYATVLHILCFVIITCVPAAICVAIQSSRRAAAKDLVEPHSIQQ
jgi:uncharacterized protein (TIRG00374 family)